MEIALFGHVEKEETQVVAQQITDFLTQKGVTVTLNVAPSKKTRFLISLGGDGTILRLVHQFPHLEIPILGVNMGHLGFMADLPLSLLTQGLEDLLQGDYTIEKRIVMEGQTGDKHCFAVNDMVIHRSQNPSLVDLCIRIDGKYVNTFSADGMIFATPNGSTAYSMAAGGPIVTPELNAFVMTPICPHTISNRPMVLLPKETIEIEYLSHLHPVEITYDGFSLGTLATGEIFTLTRSQKTFNMVNLERIDYFSTLRSKLAWAGQVRSSVLNHALERD